MIITNLVGGLGNQIFQYVIGKHLAILNNTKLYINKTYVENYEKQHQYRGYSLGHFNIEENFIEDSSKCTVVREPLAGKKDIQKFLLLKGDLTLNGYWQSYKYFDKIRDIILKEFTLRHDFSSNNLKYKEEILGTNSVSFHIRRGDKADPNKLVRFPFYGVDYFNSARKIIEERVSNPTYFIFSDDIAWAKQNIKAPSIIYIEGNYDKTWEDLILMSMCKHNIIVNSSLSWWGAWLNQNKDKIVITPKKWYNDLAYDVKDYNLEGWIEV